MLSARYRELLTAYFDRELNPRERAVLREVLRQSSEARKLFRRLRADAQALHNLPRHALPADFSQHVLQAAADRGLRPGVRPPASGGGLPAWVGLATAAAVLIAVGAAVFLHFADASPDEGFALAALADVPTPDPLVAQLAGVAAQHYAADVGVEVPLADLGQEKVRTRLAAELRKAPAHHLTVTSASNARAVADLAMALRSSNINLLIDRNVRAGLKQQQARASYLVYAEDVRPEELIAALQRFGGQDRAVRGAQPVARSVLLNSMNDDDRRHLSGLLGVPAAQLQPHKELPMPIFVPKEQGGKGVRSPGREPLRFAVVLPYNGSTTDLASSPEIKRFLQARQSGPRPGTVQVYLVLHEATI